MSLGYWFFQIQFESDFRLQGKSEIDIQISVWTFFLPRKHNIILIFIFSIIVIIRYNRDDFAVEMLTTVSEENIFPMVNINGREVMRTAKMMMMRMLVMIMMMVTSIMFMTLMMIITMFIKLLMIRTSF